MKKVAIYAFLALFVIVGSYQMVMAKPGRGSGDTPPAEPKNFPISFVAELKLTDDQVNKITPLIQNNNTACAILEDKVQAAKTKLNELQWSKSFTKEAADQLIKEMKDTMTMLQTNHQKLMVDIKGLLTPEQIQIFNQISRGQGDGRGPGNGKGPGRG